ncbi:hypothetical protein C7B65_25390 [Phormidesmis priestleyi ULC007]|uniref:Uncharacterized protein n=1 Tax=Phormidesmis priestleyi ULC007 TaxID=1920490 RepID=A0A2T1D3N9_9CYAN|nr:hypothetical protein [Phormidesmis priestleyi]PSB15023.1 hypothetical protein C7B65_25385 [Phormidesmis priestleyi ULC007]PSB15024.1 hypothetical protein C7B65_25390 [Phormidesmis priestleyi ULC007]
MLSTTVSTASIIDLLRKTVLTADEQIQIEGAVTAIAQERNWARHTAAWWLNQQAFSENG